MLIELMLEPFQAMIDHLHFQSIKCIMRLTAMIRSNDSAPLQHDFFCSDNQLYPLHPVRNVRQQFSGECIKCSTLPRFVEVEKSDVHFAQRATWLDANGSSIQDVRHLYSCIYDECPQFSF